MTFAADHAATITLAGYSPTHPALRRVTAACACGCWVAEAVTDTDAPRYDPGWLPTQLRALHRDHQVNVRAGIEDTDAEWATALARLEAAS